jgi:hypothetical protein
MTSGSFRVTMTSGLVGILQAHLNGRGRPHPAPGPAAALTVP